MGCRRQLVKLEELIVVWEVIIEAGVVGVVLRCS